MPHLHNFFQKRLLILLVDQPEQRVHIPAGIAEARTQRDKGFRIGGVAYKLHPLRAFGHLGFLLAVKQLNILF